MIWPAARRCAAARGDPPRAARVAYRFSGVPHLRHSRGLTPPDVALLNRVVASVETSEAALSLIVRILTGDLPEDCRDCAALFRTRFQQLTGPLMAKSVEDTLFFRRTLSLRSMKWALTRRRARSRYPAFTGDAHSSRPSARRAAGHLHARYQARRRRPGAALHPDGGAGTLGRKSRPLAADEPDPGALFNDGTAPNAADTWMIYRALAGVWPATLSPDDADGLASLEERFLGFLEKRCAKRSSAPTGSTATRAMRAWC